MWWRGPTLGRGGATAGGAPGGEVEPRSRRAGPGRRDAASPGGAQLALAGCLALGFAGCPVAPPPGDEQMGLYLVQATGGERACELEEMSAADFEFDLALSRFVATGQAFVTFDGVSRSGDFDGQVVTSVATASRVFGACRGCNTRLIERLELAVLSRSQAAAVGGECPAEPLDGGVPAPSSDGGIALPGPTSEGYDAVRVCGELETRVVADGTADGGACEPQCGACTVKFRLNGARR